MKGTALNVITSMVIDTCTPGQLQDVARLCADLTLGLSSSGMLTWAALGNSNPATYNGYHPFDSDDLDRCEKLYAAAPAWLVANMTGLMAEFRAEIAERNAAVEAERREYEAQQAEFEANRRAALEETAGLAVTLDLNGRQASILSYIVNDWRDGIGADVAPFSADDVEDLITVLRRSAPLANA